MSSRTARWTLAGALALGGLGMAVGRAQDPPLPTHFRLYGTVQVDDVNLSPPEQDVVALIGDRACGNGRTFLADAGPEVPETDRGRTVYTLDVLAGGARPGERLGCGQPGAPIVLWFPESLRFSLEAGTFGEGGQRLDVSLRPPHGFLLRTALVAADAGR